MQFEWDENKFKANAGKHEIAFTEACLIFADESILTRFDAKHSENEDRWISVGLTPDGKLLLVAHTFTILEAEEVVRLISAREASTRESEVYYARRKI